MLNQQVMEKMEDAIEAMNSTLNMMMARVEQHLETLAVFKEVFEVI